MYTTAIAFLTLTGYFDQNMPMEEAVMVRYRSLAQNQLLLQKEYQALNDKVIFFLSFIYNLLMSILIYTAKLYISHIQITTRHVCFQVFEAETELAELKDLTEREIMVSIVYYKIMAKKIWCRI